VRGHGSSRGDTHLKKGKVGEGVGGRRAIEGRVWEHTAGWGIVINCALPCIPILFVCTL
jgi:hypothetical protein